MITEHYYNRRLIEFDATTNVYDEVNAFLKEKADSARQEADALAAKPDCGKSPEDFVKETNLLAESVACYTLMNKLQDNRIKMLKDMNRLMNQYKFQLRSRKNKESQCDSKSAS